MTNSFLLTLIVIQQSIGSLAGAYTKNLSTSETPNLSLTDISVDSTDIEINIFDRNGKIYFEYEYTYYLSREVLSDSLVVGYFYGFRNDLKNVTIYEGETNINMVFDSIFSNRLDILFHLRELSQGFKFNFQNKTKTIIKVKGISKNKYCECIGMGMVQSAIVMKHPLLNCSRIANEAQFYLYNVRPRLWQDVGRTQLIIHYPKRWLMQVNCEDQYYKYSQSRRYGSTNGLMGIDDSIITRRQRTDKYINNNTTMIFYSVLLKRPERFFYPGGPYFNITYPVGESDQTRKIKALQIGWEPGLDLERIKIPLTALFTRIAVETNFKSYSAIVPNIQLKSFFLLAGGGLDFGFPYYTSEKAFGYRVGVSFEGSCIGFSINRDYNLKEHKWKPFMASVIIVF